MKKITVTLTDKAEKYFNEVAYSLDFEGRTATQSEVISHCLQELSDFEQTFGGDLTTFLQEYHAKIAAIQVICMHERRPKGMYCPDCGEKDNSVPTESESPFTDGPNPYDNFR